MKKILLSTLVMPLIVTSVFASNQAREIMEKADARDDGSSVISTMQMTLIDGDETNLVGQTQFQV